MDASAMNGEEPVEGQPYKLPAIRLPKYGGDIIVYPNDYDSRLGFSTSFVWKLKTGNNPELLTQIPHLNQRIRIHPATGEFNKTAH